MVQKYNVNDIKKKLLAGSMNPRLLLNLPKEDLLRVFLTYREPVVCGDDKKEKNVTLLVAAIYNDDDELVWDLVHVAKERLEHPEQYPLLWYRGQGFMKYPGFSDDKEYTDKRQEINRRLGEFLDDWVREIGEIGRALDTLQRGEMNGIYNIPREY